MIYFFVIQENIIIFVTVKNNSRKAQLSHLPCGFNFFFNERTL